MNAGGQRETAHSLEMHERERLELSGVLDVISFDETNIQISTSSGELSIDGSELHITKLNVASGEVSVSGRINSLSYYENEKRQKTGALSKFFK